MPSGFTFEEALEEPKEKEPFSFTDAVGPDIGFPQLGPQATLPDFLQQPEQKLTPFQGEIVPSAFTGKFAPEEVAALPTDLIPQEPKPTDFQMQKQRTWEPSPAAVGAMGFIPPPSMISPTTSRTRTDEEIMRQASEMSPIPAIPGIKEATPSEGERIPTRMGMATVGGLAPPPSVLARQQEPSTDTEVAAGREAINLALGIPRFATSLQGIVAAYTGAAAPLATTAYFTADVLGGLGKQIHSTYENWDTMSQPERVTAIEDIIGSGALGTILAIHTGKGAFDRFTKGGPVAELPPATPEDRANREQRIQARSKAFGITELPMVEGAIDESHPHDVAQSLGGGKFVLSKENFHKRLEQDLGKGVSLDEAIDNILVEESVHDKFKNLKADPTTGQPSGDEMALGLWNNMSPLEQRLFRRKLHGSDWKNRSLTDLQFGHEALRFAFQRLKNIRPGEHIFGTSAEIRTSKVLTALEDAIRWVRKNVLRTDAGQRQAEYLDHLKSQVDTIKEGKAAEGRPPLYRGTTLEQWQAIQRGEQPQSEFTTGGNTWATTSLESAQAYSGRTKGKNSVVIEYKDSAHDKVSKLTDDPGDRRRQGPLRLEDVQRVTDGEGNVIYEAPKKKGTADASGIRGTEKVAEREVRPPVGEETPLRQQGETPGAQEGVAQEAQVPLEKAPPTAPTEPTPGTRQSINKYGVAGDDSRMIRAIADGTKPVGWVEVLNKDNHALLQSLIDQGKLAKQKVKGGVVIAKPENLESAVKSFASAKTAEENGKLFGYTPKEVEEFKTVWKKAPPAARTVGAQPEQVPTGLATTPPGELKAPGGPAATPSISPAFPEVKARELDALVDKLNDKKSEITKAEYERYRTLSNELEAAERQAGGGVQPSEPLAMSRKENGRDASPEEMLGFAKFEGLPVPKKSSIPLVMEDSKGNRFPALSEGWGGAPVAGDINRTALWVSYPIIGKDGKLAWSTGLIRPGDKIVAGNPHSEPLAMSRKTPETEEGRVVASVMQIVGGIGNDPQRRELVQSVAKQILALPKAEWGPALTDFHAQWKAQEIAEADKQVAQKAPDLEQISKATGIPLESLQAGEALSPENIRKAFGSIDRQGIYRAALGALNKPIEKVVPPSASDQPQILPAGGEPVNKAVTPRYAHPYNEFMADFKERHPELPEWAAKEVWVEAANDVLNNASGERIAELLRQARMEKRFLGNLPGPSAKDPSEQRRVIPDADPQPILLDISKAPKPTDSVKFRRFLATRDLTPEQGMEVLKQLDAKLTETLRQRNAMLEGTAPKVRTKSGEEVLAAGREPMGEGERADLVNEWRKGQAINQKRREQAIDALSEWLTEPATKVQKDPMRRKIGIDDIWWELKGSKKGSYASYNAKEGQDQSFLKKVLARGTVKGKTASKLSRMVALLVDKTTGDYHAVSVYVRDGIPRIYDPSGPAGSKEKSFLDLSQVLPRYRVAASMMIKDPLYRLHQKWLSEPGKTGEQKYNDEIGAVARLKEDASQEQWQEYLESQRAEQSEEERAQFEQRFEEDKPAGAGEEGPTPSIRKQREQENLELGVSNWKDIQDPDSIKQKKPIPIESQIAIDAWMKGGVGRGPLGLFETDLRSLAGHSLTGNEAESVYELLQELNVKSGYDFERLMDKVEVALGIERPEEQRAGLADVVKYKRAPLTMSERLSGRDIAALYGIDKIANRIHNELLRSTYEQRRLAPLRKKAMEGKKADADPLPDDDYKDMNPAERAYADALDSLKYRALLNTFDRLYEIANEARTAKAGTQEGAAGEFATPPDVRAFREKSLNRYGDTARRSVEQAASSAQRGVEITGPKPGRRVPSVGGVTAGKRFPAPVPPPEMLPPGTLPPPAGGPSRGAFPLPGVPTTPSNIGGPKFKGQLPATIPERGTPVPYGRADKGFVPSAPSRHELLTGKPLGVDMPGEPAAMTRKGYGPSRRAQDEMVEQGRALPRPDPNKPIVPKEQLIARGRELVLGKKINPEKEMARYEHGGYMSVDSSLAFRYWGYRLQERADAAVDKYGPKSKQADEAMKLSDQWQRRLENASGQMFARTGHAMQGWNQIGPDDMSSTTFVRRFLKKAKAKEKGVNEDDYDLSDEDIEEADAIAKNVAKHEDGLKAWEMLVGEESSKGLDPELDPGNKKMVSEFDNVVKNYKKGAAEGLKKGKPTSSAMAMKGEGDLAKLDDYTEDLLGNLGMSVMADLSKAGDLTDARWLQEMAKVLASPDVDRTDLEPYLPHIRAVSEEIRNTAINNYIGTGDAVKDARSIFTRKRPPIEASIAAIHRALEADPSGKTMTPAESYHVWNYIKSRFLEKDSPEHTLDFREIRTKASAELGIKDDVGNIVPGREYSQLRLFRAMSSNRTMRTMTEELIKRMRDEARVKGQAMNWLKNQQYPNWLRAMRMFPRLFFWDKIMGHGLVPMITHAPTMMFNPSAWSVYFGAPGKKGAWGEMYRMTFGTVGKDRVKGADYHKMAMEDLVNDEDFEFAKKCGLQHDPFKFTDDYQIEGLQKVFGNKMVWLTAGRGFDALKTLRFAMWKKWFRSLPEHLQNEESGRLIADSVNHATGIVKTQLPGPIGEAASWTMFAPKLELSRWAYLFKDTIKAADIVRKWKTASMEQRAWAVSELKQKAMVVGWYYGMLALNQAFLKMSGSDQDVNAPFLGNGMDVTKPDFMQFKVAGFKVGVASPLIGVFKMLGQVLHAARGERTKFEKLTSRQKQLGEIAWSYGRGKMSPLSSFATDMVTQEDFSRRPLPWSSEPVSRARALRGVHPYGTGEYFAETFSPIPVQEAIKETFRSQGMDESTASHLMKALTIAGSMSATGARVTEDEQ